MCRLDRRLRVMDGDKFFIARTLTRDGELSAREENVSQVRYTVCGDDGGEREKQCKGDSVMQALWKDSNSA